MKIVDSLLDHLMIRGCSDKKAIKNKEKADKEIEHLASKGVLMFYYHCPFCLKFHLTSSPPSSEFNSSVQKAVINRFNSAPTYKKKRRRH